MTPADAARRCREKCDKIDACLQRVAARKPFDKVVRLVGDNWKVKRLDYSS